MKLNIFRFQPSSIKITKKLLYEVLFLSITIFIFGQIGEALIPGILSNRLFFLLMSFLILLSISVLIALEGQMEDKVGASRKQKKSWLIAALAFASALFLWTNREFNMTLALLIVVITIGAYFLFLKSVND